MSASSQAAAGLAPLALLACLTACSPHPPAPTPGQTFRDCPSCPLMVELPAGSFTIGSPDSEPGRFAEEGPQRVVRIQALGVGKFDVTRGQWAEFAMATERPVAEGCEYSGLPATDEVHASWRHLGFEQTDDHPVVCVTWADAQAYAEWLSTSTGHRYRLLSEAEWEYAARAGSQTPFPWGAAASHEYANFGTDSCCGGLAAGPDQWVNTSPVGSFPLNGFGLADMQGNVLQWVQDCFSASYSSLSDSGTANETDVVLSITGPLADLSGSHSCAYRMLRGGDWGDPGAMIRSAFRNFAPPPHHELEEYRSAGVGFRVATTR